MGIIITGFSFLGLQATIARVAAAAEEVEEWAVPFGASDSEEEDA